MNVFDGTFLYDDRNLIQENVYIRSFSYIKEIFSSGVSAGAGNGESNLYRPFVNFVHMLLYNFFDQDVRAFHILNVIIHIFNAFFVFLLVRILRFSVVGAGFSALLFLLHPVQTEAVSYMAGLPDVLVTFFILGGILLFHRALVEERRSYARIQLGLVFLIYVLALLTKEYAVVAFPLATLLAWFYRDKLGGMKRKQCLPVLIGLAVVTGLYLVLKFTVFTFSDSIGLVTNEGRYTQDIFIRFTSFMRAMWEYLVLIFYPRDLYFIKPPLAYSYLGWQGWIGLFTMAGGGIIAWLVRRSTPTLTFAYLWFFIALFPVSGIVIPVNAIYFEHWMYLPIVAVGITVALLYDSLNARFAKWAFVVLFIIALSLFAYRTIERNKEWADPVLFYERELAHYASATAYNQLGYEYFKQLKPKRAVEYYKKAIELNDTYPHPHVNLAMLYLTGNNTAAAVEEYYLALQIDPNFIMALRGLKVAAEQRGQDVLAGRFEVLIKEIEKGDAHVLDYLPSKDEFLF